MFCLKASLQRAKGRFECGVSCGQKASSTEPEGHLCDQDGQAALALIRGPLGSRGITASAWGVDATQVRKRGESTTFFPVRRRLAPRLCRQVSIVVLFPIHQTLHMLSFPENSSQPSRINSCQFNGILNFAPELWTCIPHMIQAPAKFTSR